MYFNLQNGVLKVDGSDLKSNDEIVAEITQYVNSHIHTKVSLSLGFPLEKRCIDMLLITLKRKVSGIKTQR